MKKSIFTIAILLGAFLLEAHAIETLNAPVLRVQPISEPFKKVKILSPAQQNRQAVEKLLLEDEEMVGKNKSVILDEVEFKISGFTNRIEKVQYVLVMDQLQTGYSLI
jgi:hypothetical protein